MTSTKAVIKGNSGYSVEAAMVIPIAIKLKKELAVSMKCKGGWFDEVLEVLMNVNCVPTSSFPPLVISLKVPGNQIHPMTMQAHTMVSFSHVHHIKT